MFKFRIAAAEEAPEFHGVMLAAYDNLENKELYVCDDLDYVSAVLKDEREGFGVIASVCSNPSYASCETGSRNSDNDAFNDNLDCHKAVGVLLVTFPKLSEENLARDVGGGEFVKLLLNTAHIETTAVRPDYQGNGLQTQMIEYACEFMKLRFNNIKYVCATVSPDNAPSLKSFIKCGFNIAATKEKYGGKLRHILVREMSDRTESFNGADMR